MLDASSTIIYSGGFFMRIDMKRAAEVNERKGLTWRTLLALAWFVCCLIFAHFFTGWLVSNGTLDKGLVHGTLALPPVLNMDLARMIATPLMVGVLQFFAIIFFAMTNPAAKVRSGKPSAIAQSVDYYEQQYNRHA
jgi:hypothetical protein